MHNKYCKFLIQCSGAENISFGSGSLSSNGSSCIRELENYL
jgi:hypothetical protein